jgi:hypothetical protein
MGWNSGLKKAAMQRRDAIVGLLKRAGPTMSPQVQQQQQMAQAMLRQQRSGVGAPAPNAPVGNVSGPTMAPQVRQQQQQAQAMLRQQRAVPAPGTPMGMRKPLAPVGMPAARAMPKL